MNRLARFCLYRLPALLYMAFIFHMSSGPVKAGAFEFFADYVLHCVGYAALYILVYWGLHEGFREVPGRGGYWIPLVVTVLYALSDELHQSFVPGRDASMRDVLADTVGGFVGILVVHLAVRLAAHPRKDDSAGAGYFD